MNQRDLPELREVLQRLAWFRDLSRGHRTDMLTEVVECLVVDASKADFTALLDRWAQVAHADVKWSRFELLRESGLLDPPRAA